MKPNAAGSIEDIWPLAPLQATMLVASLRAPKSGVFVQQEMLLLPEPVNSQAFQTAWQALVQRTPALRASFHWQDLEQPIQVVHRKATLPFEQLDWRGLDGAGFEARLAEYLNAGRRSGFNLERAPLMRVTLIRSPPGTHFIWQFHHILFDGWSSQMLVDEVIEHYRALVRHAPFKPTVRRSVRHYIDWLAARDVDGARQYWQDVLRGYNEPLQIGLPHPAAPPERAGADDEFDAALDAPTSQRLRTFAREHSVTLNTLLQGAWALLLSHYADRDDVVFGAVVAGRPPEVAGIEQMIGLFINAVPVRVRAEPMAALMPWLKDLQAAQARGTVFHYLGSAELQRCSGLPPGTPLFETLLVFENFPMAATTPTGQASAGLDLARADVPLTLLVVPGDRLLVKLRFDRSRFRATDMAPLAEHLLQLLRAMLDAPFARLADLSPLSAGERSWIIDGLSSGGAAVGPDPLVLLQRLAQSSAAEAAFIDRERLLDFRTLDLASSRLARWLRRAGVTRGVPVGVSAPRSLEQVVAFYSVLKAHGIYMPLDPAYPERRLAQMLEDARPAVLLTAGSAPIAGEAEVIDISDILEPVPDEAPAEEPEPEAWQAEDPAYIVFTSGSTGRPKAVLAHWGQVANRLAWMWRGYPFATDEVACQRTAINFVDSLWELLGAALQGVPTLIVPERTAQDAHALIALLAAHGVTRLWFVPSLLKMLLEARPDLGVALPKLRFWVSSGEPLPADLYARFCQAHPAATLYNLYGTSEVWDATWFDPVREPPVRDTVPIGRPIDGVRAYVLDRHCRPLSFEVAGELCIGGAGVARGYLGSAAQNAERFMVDPFAAEPSARMYRTGDLARVQRDGLIVHLGRRDQQVKLRGFRIELADIEAALRCAPEVNDAVVLLQDERLVGYVVVPERVFDVRSLLAGLRERLPEALLPAAIVRLDALPLTPNGKLDRAAVPSPGQAAVVDESVALSPLQAEVQSCFEEVLQVRQAGLDADFFRDLGGHSLLALRVSSRLSRQFAIEVPAATLFDFPTARQLANWLAERTAENDEANDTELLDLIEALPEAERTALFAAVSHPYPGDAP